jgi:protein gp37
MMLDARWFGRDHWGPGAPRRYFDEPHWRQPINWNRIAEAAGQRKRVFCASMADVFDNEVNQTLRDRLWLLIRQTPHLDWLVLTKRIGNARRMLPKDWGEGYPNVWIIISADQSGLARDCPKLLEIPAVVHGVSIQPQLAALQLGEFASHLGWVINGGESGAGARPFHLEWARSLAAECASAGTPIFVQRLGGNPFEGGRQLRLRHHAGADVTEWPPDLRIREIPKASVAFARGHDVVSANVPNKREARQQQRCRGQQCRFSIL